MSDLAAYKQVVAKINEVLSGAATLESLDEIVAPDFVDHAAFPGQREGRDGFKDTVQSLRAAFDQTVRSVHTVAEEDLVIDHWISEGVHRGAFFGKQPSERMVRVEGFSVWRFRDGRVVEAWGLIDLAGLMRQLG